MGNGRGRTFQSDDCLRKLNLLLINVPEAYEGACVLIAWPTFSKPHITRMSRFKNGVLQIALGSDAVVYAAHFSTLRLKKF